MKHLFLCLFFLPLSLFAQADFDPTRGQWELSTFVASSHARAEWTQEQDGLIRGRWVWPKGIGLGYRYRIHGPWHLSLAFQGEWWRSRYYLEAPHHYPDWPNPHWDDLWFDFLAVGVPVGVGYQRQVGARGYLSVDGGAHMRLTFQSLFTDTRRIGYFSTPGGGGTLYFADYDTPIRHLSGWLELAYRHDLFRARRKDQLFVALRGLASPLPQFEGRLRMFPDTVSERRGELTDFGGWLMLRVGYAWGGRAAAG